MSTGNVIRTLEANIRARYDGRPLAELRELLELQVKLHGDSAAPGHLPGESGSAERLVCIAIESVYRDRYAASLADVDCTTLASMTRALVDARGHYVSRVAAAESNAIEYRLIEARHLDAMAMADELPSALVASVDPCELHAAAGGAR